MGPGFARREEGFEGVRRHAALLRLAARVHLHEDFEPDVLGGAVLLQRRAQRSAIQGMEPRERTHHRFRLVALQAADEMPVGRLERALGKGLLEVRATPDGFLHVVLGDVAETGGDALDDGVVGDALRDTEQADGVGGASGALGRRRHPVAQLRQTLGDGVHRSPRSRSARSRSARVSSRGSPITFVALPSMRVTKRRPSPWNP